MNMRTGKILPAAGLFLALLGMTARAQEYYVKDLYKEKYRPRFHFTARQWTYHMVNPGQKEEGWVNDINGLVYLDGTYHLFGQRWCQAWVHATSTDLIHWTETEPAFWDDDHFGCTQSGTCVIDSNNTSGLAAGSNPVMVCFWSSQNNLDQCISYSNDKGVTWTKYEGNPVLSPILEANPFQTLDQVGVGRLVKMCVEDGLAAKPDLEIGICGEHGGDPASIDFCHRAGLDYVSCSPFRVPVARLAAAQAKIKNG